MKYFTIKEFTFSDKAKQLHIDNTPPQEIVEHITEFVDCILDRIREEWGSALIISSGYRCDALNKAVGGANTSGHKFGWCADLQPKNGKIKEFAEFVKNWLIRNYIPWDELIFEKSGKTTWVHFAWKGMGGRQRMKTFSLVVK